MPLCCKVVVFELELKAKVNYLISKLTCCPGASRVKQIRAFKTLGQHISVSQAHRGLSALPAMSLRITLQHLPEYTSHTSLLSSHSVVCLMTFVLIEKNTFYSVLQRRKFPFTLITYHYSTGKCITTDYQS